MLVPVCGNGISEEIRKDRFYNCQNGDITPFGRLKEGRGSGLLAYAKDNSA